MNQEYDHKAIESKWQKRWQSEKPKYTVNKDKKYVLVEFPYPSGNLHVGHWYAFACTDVYVRFLRMQGYDVIFPIGFDAFGLPAENAAIKNNLNPKDWTFENIDYMRKQLSSMGATFDWDREVITASPEYYKWTQWLFIEFFKKGLAYQKESNVNWCPSCKTVLANEQVKDGKCERCDSEVEQKKMNQWFIKITDYADKLVDDLDKLNWPEAIKDGQRNWIGRKEGAEITFKTNKNQEIKIFTTRPDTLYGVTYVVIAPEHKEIESLISDSVNKDEIEKYIKGALNKKELDRIADNKEKTGVKIEGLKAIHPLTSNEVPVYVADYVLGSYGTGAVMAVPAHDERDFEFAKKYNLEIKPVIESTKECFTGNGKIINSEEFNGKKSDEIKEEITKKAGGEITKTYRLRDWGVSRQRYWGCPIPMIICSDCGAVPVSESELPVILPEIENYLPRDDGKSPLAKNEEWMNVKCPKCNKDAHRETDTLDTFVDSSWYFLRYTDPNNNKEFASKESLNKWMPVDFYSGGAEHTTMHLLFARFFTKAMNDIGLLDFDEPFKERLNRSLILGPDGNKMSKSKGNVIDPDAEVEKIGADTVRAYLSFIGPYNEVGAYPWDSNGIVGIRRFIEKVYSLKDKIIEKDSDETIKKLHQTIKKVSDDYGKLKFNTAISALMILTNDLIKTGCTKETLIILARLVMPIAPHLGSEVLESQESENNLNWPEFNPDKIIESDVNITIQFNSKVRKIISIPKDTSEETIIEIIKNDEELAKWGDISSAKKIIFIPNKLINFVL